MYRRAIVSFMLAMLLNALPAHAQQARERLEVPNGISFGSTVDQVQLILNKLTKTEKERLTNQTARMRLKDGREVSVLTMLYFPLWPPTVPTAPPTHPAAFVFGDDDRLSRVNVNMARYMGFACKMEGDYALAQLTAKYGKADSDVTNYGAREAVIKFKDGGEIHLSYNFPQGFCTVRLHYMSEKGKSHVLTNIWQ
jgi:hypothetical protein